MRRGWLVAVMTMALVVGVVVGAVAARKAVEPGIYIGVPPQQAAAALLQQAREQAGKGTWERIAVARFCLLAGQRKEGQAIIDEVLAGKPEPSDWMRIGRAYAVTGDWDRAQGFFDKVLEAKPKDADWLAEIGAFHNIHGNRTRAEELFQRSFVQDPGNHENLAIAGGSYVGVAPGR